VKTWLSGDFHTQNVGFFDNDNGSIVFDLNDFDESYIGPFYWDLLRYTTSLFLMQPELGTSLSTSDIRDVASSFLSTYQSTLEAVNGNSTEKDLYLDKAALTDFMDDQLDSVQSKYSTATLLAKWTSLQNGVRRFNFTNPDLGVPTASDQTEVCSYWSNYLSSVSSARPISKTSYKHRQRHWPMRMPVPTVITTPRMSPTTSQTEPCKRSRSGRNSRPRLPNSGNPTLHRCKPTTIPSLIL
jgi:uncharacterized protein (DUF2252 family)